MILKQFPLDEAWKSLFSEEIQKDYFVALFHFLEKEYADSCVENNLFSAQESSVFPPKQLVFNAFNVCPLQKIKVVILGQDPYHERGQAHGLAFSVPEGVKIPPSLRNIYKEIQQDLGIIAPSSGNLERWAKQGVLLLNATLTVREGQAGSHQGKGWETFTDAVIRLISERADRVVFMLWGAYAQQKKSLIDASKHLILTTSHPSPLSAHRGFLGCKHFSKANDFLQKKIDW
jgi:uracil-DNA glycosylase